jgi:3-hydroxyisobutyrate dehydrogenase-like beta-hydroxyacid dehydrogenase
MQANLGLIGVGLMGLGIATNLVRKGHSLTVMAHAGNQPLDELTSHGVKVVDTAAQVARHSDILLICVTGSAQVEAVLTGEQGALAGLRPGAIVIDCSTSLPQTSTSMAAATQAIGGQFMDAAMTRTPVEAMQGRLNLLVGGPIETLEAVRPVLACFAENITHTGPVGSGHQMKLLHNFVSLGTVTLIAEAAACARAAGLDSGVFTDILSRGGAGGTALERIKPYLLHDDPTGLRFSLANALKDISYYTDMVTQMGGASAVAQGVRSNLQTACERGDPQGLVPELVARLSLQQKAHD